MFDAVQAKLIKYIMVEFNRGLYDVNYVFLFLLCDVFKTVLDVQAKKHARIWYRPAPAKQAAVIDEVPEEAEIEDWESLFLPFGEEVKSEVLKPRRRDVCHLQLEPSEEVVKKQSLEKSAAQRNQPLSALKNSFQI